MDDDDMEPLHVDGLGSLTAAQRALAEFLEVDKDLLAGAGLGSPASQDEGPSQKDMDVWLYDLHQDEVTKILKQLLAGNGQQAERTLKNRFAAWRRGLLGDRIEAPRRTVGALRRNADAAEKIRMEKQKRDRKEREIKRRKEREVYLKNLYKDLPKAWKSVQQAVERGSGLAYDEACCILVDLSEAYSIHASRKTFQQKLRKSMAGHMKRKALIQRLVKASIWEDK
jgi:hypothetical protein